MKSTPPDTARGAGSETIAVVRSFEDYAFAAVASALEVVPPGEVSDVYVVSLFVYDEEDDPCRPTITVGYNTEDRVAAATSRASDAAEAR